MQERKQNYSNISLYSNLVYIFILFKIPTRFVSLNNLQDQTLNNVYNFFEVYIFHNNVLLVLCLLDFGQTAWARNLTVYKIIRKSAAFENLLIFNCLQI